jgi:hypothetical protein
MSLGLSEKEQCKRMFKTNYNESAITFGEARAGSMEAYNFSSEASITTLHAEKEGGGASVASAMTMAKSVFSIATNITSDEEGKGATNNEKTEKRSVIEIDGIEMVELEVKSLTDNMNRATEKLQLSSQESSPVEESQMEDSKDEEDDTYMTDDNPKEGSSAHEIDLDDYKDAQEVSLGGFDAVHANKFQMPVSFKQQLWNEAGPTVDSMVIQLILIKEHLEHNKAGMPFEWMGVSKELRLFLDKEAGKGISDQITYIDNMLAEMYQMNPTGVRNFDPLNVESDEEQNASKTQGTPPRAQEARPKEEAATPDMRADRDKEGVQSLGMAASD